MKTFNIFITCSILLLTQSCNKGLHSKLVEGRVIDVATGNGVPYAEVTLSLVGNTFVYTGTGIGTHKCDENGSFSFHFDADGDALYYLQVQNKENYYKASGSDTEFFGREKKRNITLKLNSHCFVYAHIKSTGKYKRVFFESTDISAPDSAMILATGVSNTDDTYTLFCYTGRTVNGNAEVVKQFRTLKVAPFDTGHIYFEY